jgi:hypothetical protein
VNHHTSTQNAEWHPIPSPRSTTAVFCATPSSPLLTTLEIPPAQISSTSLVAVPLGSIVNTPPKLKGETLGAHVATHKLTSTPLTSLSFSQELQESFF